MIVARLTLLEEIVVLRWREAELLDGLMIHAFGNDLLPKNVDDTI